MQGVYRVKVYNKRAYYDLSLQNKMTLVGGDSGTGKTTLINMIDDFGHAGKASGVTVESTAECRVIRGRKWFEELAGISESIVFIDDGAQFIDTEDFAAVVQRSDNYYVLMTRRPLSQLPYDKSEIHRLEQDREESSRLKKAYNTLMCRKLPIEFTSEDK